MKMKLFKKKDFSLLMIGKTASLVGTQMQSFALSLYVLKTTGSATAFASVLAVTIIPQLILGPIAGVFVDWFDRKKIIVYLDLLQGIIVALYALIYYFNGEISLRFVYALVISLTLCSVLFQPAASTIIPTIINKEELLEANSINTFTMKIGNLVAPALAGILFGFYGLLVIFIFNSVSFIISSICEMIINIPKLNKKPEKITFKAFLNDFSEGISFIKNKKTIFQIILIGLVLNFVGDPVFSIGITFISKKVLQVSDFQYGTIESIFVSSMLISPLIANKIGSSYKLSKIIFLDILFTAIFIGVMAIVPLPAFLSNFDSNLIPYICLTAIIFLIGLVTSIGNIALGTYFQQQIPLNMMGRVGTVMNSVSIGAIPLGQMIFGFLYDKVPSYICIIIPAVILFVVSITLTGNLGDKDEAIVESPVVTEV